MTAERQRMQLLDALMDGPVSAHEARFMGIRHLAVRIHELRREGAEIETVRGEAGSVTVYRLAESEVAAR